MPEITTFSCNITVFTIFGPILYTVQEALQRDETRFLTIQSSIDVTGIRNERWQ